MPSDNSALVLRQLLGQAAQPVQPVLMVLRALHGQGVNHAVPMLRAGPHIEGDQVQAVFIFGEVVPQLPEQHGAVDLRVCRESGGFNLLEALNEPPLILVASLERIKTHVCPLVIPRPIAVLESPLWILRQRPLPVVINNRRKLGLSCGGGTGVAEEGGSDPNAGRDEQRGASTGRMAHSSPREGRL